MRPLVLASSSPHRRTLLARLGLPFTVAAPAVDESPRHGEAPARLVERLAGTKARAVAGDHPGALIIGSDQVAVCGGEVLNKPGDFESARRQLRAESGRRVEFLTGLALLDVATGRSHLDCVPYRVWLRDLSDAAIDAYLAIEAPYDCAGSLRSEGLGIALLSRMRGEDPTALIGLPLIRLAGMLRAEGVEVPASGCASARSQWSCNEK
jgi:MAF protein